MPDMVLIKDVRRAGHCVSGLRDFCSEHDISLRRWVTEGIPISELEVIEDANLSKVLDCARKRLTENGQ